MKSVVLTPIKENPEDYDAIMEAIIKLLRAEIYHPLLDVLKIPTKVLKNSRDDILDAVHSGQIYYSRGKFRGKFNSTLSRELRKIGAEWDRKQGCFSIPQSKLPLDVRMAISSSAYKFQQAAESINKRLDKIVPADVAGKLNLDQLFDKSIFKVETDIQKSLRNITVSPTLTPTQRERIAAEYTQNMQTYIQEFTEKEIVSLRKNIQERTMAGLRYESLIEEIEKSYGVSYNKAKFLARQETSLMMAKFKQVRYEEAGSQEYIWGCVKMTHQSKNGPYRDGEVRYYHGINEGKKFRWDTGAVVNKEGERKNPGQDYGCRCFAKPIVRFS